MHGRLGEASEIWRQSLEIDPLAAVVYNNRAVGLLWQGRLDEALSDARMVLELSPQREAAHSLVGAVYLAQAKPDAALQEILQETSERQRLLALAEVYHALGRAAESEAARASYMENYQDNAPFSIACFHALRGEPDEAFEWLDRAYAERDPYLAWMKVHLDLKNLRSDPRWLPFLRKMRLAG